MSALGEDPCNDVATRIADRDGLARADVQRQLDRMFGRGEPTMGDYKKKLARSLTADDMRRVVDMMDRAEGLTSHAIGFISDATIIVSRRDGEPLCEVWWDSENEDWLADWQVEH